MTHSHIHVPFGWRAAHNHLAGWIDLATLDERGHLADVPKSASLIIEVGANSRDTTDQLLDAPGFAHGFIYQVSQIYHVGLPLTSGWHRRALQVHATLDVSLRIIQ